MNILKVEKGYFFTKIQDLKTLIMKLVS